MEKLSCWAGPKSVDPVTHPSSFISRNSDSSLSRNWNFLLTVTHINLLQVSTRTATCTRIITFLLDMNLDEAVKYGSWQYLESLLIFICYHVFRSPIKYNNFSCLLRTLRSHVLQHYHFTWSNSNFLLIHLCSLVCSYILHFQDTTFSSL